MITNQQPEFTGAASVYPWSSSLEESFTSMNRFGEPIKMAYRKGNSLYVPRESVPLGKQDLRTKAVSKPFKSNFEPVNEEQGPLTEKSLALLKKGVSHIFEAPTGFGKCQIEGSRVLMYSGAYKLVQDVNVGDLLMGPDSVPRRVLSLCSGVTQAYELRTPRGEVIRCNEDHILSLKRTRYFQKNGAGCGGNWRGGDTVNIAVKDYINQANNFKHIMKLWKPDEVQFAKVRELTISPYVLGLLLGDGGITNYVGFSSADQVLVDALRTEAAKFGCTVTGPIGDYGWMVVNRVGEENPFKYELRNMGVFGKGSGNKSVPIDYKTATVEARLQLLAGLMDTDGHQNGNTFDWISKSEQLADDVCFLAWSVGLAAVKSRCEKECVNNGVWGTYYRVCISGDTDKVPCRLDRKKCTPRKQKKNVRMHGFTVHDIGEQKYFGFNLDRDQLYLDENFFVNHNSVCLGHIACEIGMPTLIVVNKTDLMDSWYDALVHVLGVPPKDVGKVQQDTCEWKGKRFVIGMIHSLVIPDKYPQEMYNSFGLMIADECDTVAAETFVNVCWLIPAALRLGCTATPDRGDGKWKVVTAHMGPVMVRGTMVPMKAKVLVQKTEWHIPTYKKFEDGSYTQTKIAHSPGRMMTVSKAMSMNQQRNLIVAEFVLSAFKAGRHTLILSDLTDHLDRLFQVIAGVGVSGENIGYYVGGMSKAELEITKKKKPVILGTYRMVDRGTNVVKWDSLVMATPRSNVKQAVGRVLRFAEGKKQPVILDLVDYDKIFSSFYYSRLRQYASIGAEVINL
jgi:hypothetical protein